jgi:ubiquinone/menaquinone biosynthesis C-methylase UbiE
MAEYVLQTGKEGVERLDAVEGMFGTASRAFLTEVGLREGLRVLDVGCGTGTLTSWIARTVGNRGHVAATDADARQLDIARKNAVKTGVSNVEFTQARLGSAALPHAGYDIVHCRLVLMHVANVNAALGEMVAAVRPGGLLVCEETSANSVFTSPPCEAISRMNELFRALGRSRGLDFDVGDKLFGLMTRHTSRLVGSRFVQPMVPLGAARQFLELAAAEIKPALLASGLATESGAVEMLHALRSIREDAGSFYAPGRLAQVAGVVERQT